MLSTELSAALRVAIHTNHPETRTFKQALSILLMDMQEATCAICGGKIDALGGWTVFDGLLVTYPMGNLDHVVARSMGGADGLGNLVLAHHACNSRKNNKPPTGCQCVWLLAVNNRLGVEPRRW